MKHGMLEAKYYETYFVANAISNILASPVAYVRNLDEFYGDLSYVRFLKPFQRFSAFHQFIQFIIESLIFEALEEVDLGKQRAEAKKFEKVLPKEKFTALPINGALNHYGIYHQSFEHWLREQNKSFDYANADDANDYYYRDRLIRVRRAANLRFR